MSASRAAVEEHFASEWRRIRGVLRATAGDPAFQEAVLWQNRGAFTWSVLPLARASVDHVDSTTRKRELLVAAYLQRYCVKNDTIGFFGPVGWARASDAAGAIVVACGPRLVSARETYFESWCIDALARALDADADLRPWLVPRLVPTIRLDGTRLMIGPRVARELSADEVRLLNACDGLRHAQAIAWDLRTPGSSFQTDDAVYATLDVWRTAGYLTWTLEGPRELHPERSLRARLEAIDDAVLRTRALARLDSVEAAAASVRGARGHVERLDRALGEFESTFTRATGVAPTRAGGQAYAARTLLYEECRRDVSVDLGADVLARLGPPLELLLESARWAAHELVRRHDAELRCAFDRLADQRTRTIGLGALLGQTSLLRSRPGTLPAVAAEVRAALQQRWADLLTIESGARRVRYQSRDLCAAVRNAFQTIERVRTPWTRCVSPDVMIDAPSVAAIQRGEYQCVIGEVHIYNTLLQSLFVDQHPHPPEVASWLELDSPDPRVVWIAPKETTPHRVHLFVGSKDFSYVTTRDPWPGPAARTLRLADLVVTDEDGTLIVRTRDERVRVTCPEFFGSILMRTASGLFRLLPDAGHQPRVTFDDVVVARETWHVALRDMTFASCREGIDRYIECQRWADRSGLPQFVFIKLPTERKPTFIDLSSPVYVDLLAKFVRTSGATDASGQVTITEMLPAPSGAWLPDSDGQRYTAEFRLAAVVPD